MKIAKRQLLSQVAAELSEYRHLFGTIENAYRAKDQADRDISDVHAEVKVSLYDLYDVKRVDDTFGMMQIQENIEQGLILEIAKELNKHKDKIVNFRLEGPYPSVPAVGYRMQISILNPSEEDLKNNKRLTEFIEEIKSF